MKVCYKYRCESIKQYQWKEENLSSRWILLLYSIIIFSINLFFSINIHLVSFFSWWNQWEKNHYLLHCNVLQLRRFDSFWWSKVFLFFLHEIIWWMKIKFLQFFLKFNNSYSITFNWNERISTESKETIRSKWSDWTIIGVCLFQWYIRRWSNETSSFNTIFLHHVAFPFVCAFLYRRLRLRVFSAREV